MSVDKENNAPLNAEPTPYGWDCAGTFVRTRLAMESFKKDGINPTPLYTAPVSAEPTDDEIIDMAVEPLGIDCDRMPYGVIVFARTLLSRYSATPAAAQPDLTQQTLDDVKAGIPARDAEIEALRKEIQALQATQAQQPVSSADGLQDLANYVVIANTTGNPDLYHDAVKALVAGVRAHGQAQLSGNTGQLDHLPDATKMVAADQFRDAAQMIEPSGNSGELPSDEELIEFATEEQFLLFCDEDECLQIAKAVLQRFGHKDADKVRMDIEAAAKALFEQTGRDWMFLHENGRRDMRRKARRVIDAARKEPGQ